MNSRHIAERYEPVTESGCWIWMGSVDGAGYPYFIRGSKKTTKYLSATRAFFEMHKGGIPNGLFVCHTCDVPLCVNPSHLFIATAKENSEDMVKKGRSASGVVRLLTMDQRREIMDSSELTSVLSNKFGICKRYVRQLRAA